METKELFDMKMLAVSPSARGLGLATDLARRAILLARRLGYRGCKAEATGAYSRKIFAKLGLVEEVLVPYGSFTLEVTGHGVLDTVSRAPGPSSASRGTMGSLSWPFSFNGSYQNPSNPQN